MFNSSTNDKIQHHTIKKQCCLLNLETQLQLSVHNRTLSDKMAYELLTLPTKDRVLIHTLFLDLELGGGKQKRLLSLLKELAYRREKSIKELLSAPIYLEILLHTGMNKPQKIANLLTLLQKEILPESSSVEESFLKRVYEMRIPPTCKISHSLSFEKDDVTVTLQFPSIEDVEKNISAIKDIIE